MMGRKFCAAEKFRNLTASWTKVTSWSLRYLEVSIIECNISPFSWIEEAISGIRTNSLRTSPILLPGFYCSKHISSLCTSYHHLLNAKRNTTISYYIRLKNLLDEVHQFRLSFLDCLGFQCSTVNTINTLEVQGPVVNIRFNFIG